MVHDIRFLTLLSLLTMRLAHGRLDSTPHLLNMVEMQLLEEKSHSGDPVIHSRSLKIARGDPVNARRFPYSMLLAFRGDDQNEHICAGVLIHEHWGVTAASCAMRAKRADRFFVGIGPDASNPTDLLKNNVEHPLIFRVVVESNCCVQKARVVGDIIVSPQFNGNKKDGGDLALLYLKKPFNATLPRLPRETDILGPGMRLVTLGWGISDVNRFFAEKLQIIDHLLFAQRDICDLNLLTYNKFSALIDDRVICATPPDLSNDVAVSICNGDEGGPLLFLDSQTFDENSKFHSNRGDPELDILHGIASFGPDCGTFGFNVYTNLVEYMQWINDTIETYIPPPPPSSGSTDQAAITMVLMIAVPISVLVLFLCLCMWIVRSRYRPRRLHSASSMQLSSKAALSKANALDQRPNQMALMHMSPFLASAPLQTVPSGMELTQLPSSPVAMSLPTNIEVTLIGRKIGSGAFGRVEEGIYADEKGVHHKVAVKTVQIGEVESRESLLNEIRIFERVGLHPNIVQCFGGRLHNSVLDETGYYIIEELMMTDLGKFFKDPKNRRNVTFRDYLQIFYETANGLEHLHECEIIHFDLKPGNILLDQNWHPKLADFGCSKKRAHSYITAGARGTIAYMAPELWLLGMFAKRAQVRGEKIDVFSFGVVMWESFTNQNPVDPLDAQNLVINELGTTDLPSVPERQATGGTNEDFKADRFPFNGTPCPNQLMELIWDCVSYYNSMRPTFQEVKTRIKNLLQMDWKTQNIDHFRL